MGLHLTGSSVTGLSSALVGGGGTTWVTGTAYKRGRVVVNPSGAVVIANVDHTAAGSYSTDTAKWDAVSPVTFALAPSNGKPAVGRDQNSLTPEDWGAVGSNATVDTAAFVAMFTHLQSGSATASHIKLTGGKAYYVNGLVPFPGLKIVGSPGASMVCTSGNMFTVSGASTYGMVFEDVLFQSQASAGGHIFAISDGVSMSTNEFIRCEFDQFNDAKSAFDGQAINSFIENHFIGGRIQHTLTATVPTVNLKSTAAGLSCNLWKGMRVIYTGNYAFHLESTNTTNYCYDNSFENINFEIANGGCVRVLSGNNTRLVNCWVYDLSTATTQDLFFFGKTTGGLASKATQMVACGRRGGTLGGGMYDANLNQAVGSSVMNCNTGTGTGYSINWNFNSGTFQGDSSVTHTNGAETTKVIDRGIALSSASTANLPAAASWPSGLTRLVSDGPKGGPQVVVSDGTKWWGNEVQEFRLATAVIDAKTVAVTDLYTVPTGKSAVVTRVVIRCTAASSITTGPTMAVGDNAGGTNMFAATSLAGLTANGKMWDLAGTNPRDWVAAGGVVRAAVTVAATGTSQTVSVDIMGYLV